MSLSAVVNYRIDVALTGARSAQEKSYLMFLSVVRERNDRRAFLDASLRAIYEHQHRGFASVAS